MPYFEMTRMALKWALTRPPTKRYPFEPRELIPGSRGALAFTQANCVYCGVCAKKCPTAALAVNRPAKQFSIDRLRCISCGYCVELCPKDSLALVPNHAAPAVAKVPEKFCA
jgi:formate hydrogenlyase subunit 6/NADH:ubiquinone oxidoreductase subunit I